MIYVQYLSLISDLIHLSSLGYAHYHPEVERGRETEGGHDNLWRTRPVDRRDGNETVDMMQQSPSQKQLVVNKKSTDDIETSFREAAAKQEDVFTLTALAHLLADLGRNDEAESCFEKALKCPPQAPTDGSSLCDRETRGLAMGWYAALVEANGSEGAEKAEELYRAALQMNKRDPLAMGNYAIFLHRIKRDHRVSHIGR